MFSLNNKQKTRKTTKKHKNNKSSYTFQYRFFLDFGLFCGTALGLSGFAYPFILFHSNVIGVTALILCLCGSLIMCVSIAVSIIF